MRDIEVVSELNVTNEQTTVIKTALAKIKAAFNDGTCAAPYSEKPSLRQVVDCAHDNLIAAMRTGKIGWTHRKGSGSSETASRVELAPWANNAWPVDLITHHRKNRSNWLKDIRYLYDDVQRCWPEVSAVRNAGRQSTAKCKLWLVAEMKVAAATNRPKKQYLAEAKDRFGVSARQFALIWARAIDETGAIGWSAPGRKRLPKSSRRKSSR